MLKDTDLANKYQSLLSKPLPADPYAKDSRIQPASIDLTIGDIYLPGVKPKRRGGLDKPKDSYVLDAGHTAVVFTQETVTLPNDLAAIGFPPTHISDKGVLMTNPGHVDPGFKGNLSFTVINMGREPFPLRRNDIIVTLVFFQLHGPCRSGYTQRRDPSATPAPHDLSQDRLNRLAPDMLDVDRRVKKITKSAEYKTRLFSIVAPILLAIFVALGTIFGPALSNWKTHFDEIQKLQLQVDQLTQKVNDLQKTLTTEVPRAPSR